MLWILSYLLTDLAHVNIHSVSCINFFSTGSHRWPHNSSLQLQSYISGPIFSKTSHKFFSMSCYIEFLPSHLLQLGFNPITSLKWFLSRLSINNQVAVLIYLPQPLSSIWHRWSHLSPWVTFFSLLHSLFPSCSSEHNGHSYPGSFPGSSFISQSTLGSGLPSFLSSSYSPSLEQFIWSHCSKYHQYADDA